MHVCSVLLTVNTENLQFRKCGMVTKITVYFCHGILYCHEKCGLEDYLATWENTHRISAKRKQKKIINTLGSSFSYISMLISEKK